MVSYTGAVKVVDFGIARVQDKFRVGGTDPGHVKGKSAYLAPEQLSTAPFDHRADLFASGILLHEMLTGRRLFKAEHRARDHEPRAPPRDPAPHGAQPRRAGGARGDRHAGAERDPDQRYQDGDQLADALEGFLLEQRAGSQELPAFLRALFKDEAPVAPAALSPEELVALTREATPENGGRKVTAELKPAGTPPRCRSRWGRRRPAPPRRGPTS